MRQKTRVHGSLPLSAFHPSQPAHWVQLSLFRALMLQPYALGARSGARKSRAQTVAAAQKKREGDRERGRQREREGERRIQEPSRRNSPSAARRQEKLPLASPSLRIRRPCASRRVSHSHSHCMLAALVLLTKSSSFFENRVPSSKKRLAAARTRRERESAPCVVFFSKRRTLQARSGRVAEERGGG